VYALSAVPKCHQLQDSVANVDLRKDNDI
jgi:hypothetical protein